MGARCVCISLFHPGTKPKKHKKTKHKNNKKTPQKNKNTFTRRLEEAALYVTLVSRERVGKEKSGDWSERYVVACWNPQRKSGFLRSYDMSKYAPTFFMPTSVAKVSHSLLQKPCLLGANRLLRGSQKSCCCHDFSPDPRASPSPYLPCAGQDSPLVHLPK